MQKRFSRGIIPKKNMNGHPPIFGHHYPIMARFRHFTHPTTAGSLHFETWPGGTIPIDRATRKETETGNGQDIVNTAKATLPDIRAPARPNRSARTRFTRRHEKSLDDRSVRRHPTDAKKPRRTKRAGRPPNRHEKVPTDRAHASLTTRKSPDGKPSGLSFRKQCAYSSLR